MSARRILHGISANIVEKGMNALIQFLLVAVLATHWGLSLYGAWILLATIPSFLAMSDFGFASAAGVEMTMLAAKGKREQALKVFQSTSLIVVVSSGLMISLAILATWLVPGSILPKAAGFDADHARLTLMLLLLYGIVCLQGSLVVAGFRCSGNYPIAVLWMAATMTFENGLLMIAVFAADAQPLQGAMILLGCRTISILLGYRLMRRKVDWLHFGLTHASLATARKLLSPALAAAVLPLSQAFTIQGTAMTLGIAAGQAAVPVFTATRVLSRVGIQMMYAAINSIAPEFSGVVARGEREGQARMLLAGGIWAAMILIPLAIVLSTFGPQIVALWTHGSIQPPYLMMWAVSLSIIFGGLASALAALLLAINRHATYSYTSLALSAATVPLTYFLAQRYGPTGAAMSMVCLDFAMAVVVVRSASGLFLNYAEIRQAFAYFREKVASLAAGHRS